MMKKLVLAMVLFAHGGYCQGLDHILEIEPNGSLNEILGISILGVGDVNGDGWPDLAAGAYGPKKTYFYWGGPGILDTIPDFVLPYVGTQMKLADLNGDGRQDLILFGYQWPPANAVRIFLGKSGSPVGFDTIPSPSFQVYDALYDNGFAIGDLNGDGYEDLILGFWTGQGRVAVYLGGPMLSDVPDFVLTGDAIGSSLGYSIQTGDINGDDYTDLAVLARGDEGLGVPQLIQTWSGGPNCRFEKGNVHQTLLYKGHDILFSFSLVDYNLDGKADLYYPDSGYGAFHWGGDTLAQYPDFRIPPSFTGFTKYFGHLAQSIDDVNGDGLPDFAFIQTPGPGACVAVYLGNYPTPAVKTAGTRCGGSFWQIAPVGDINGDGVNDFASSVPYDNIPGLPQPGYVVIFSGNRRWVTSVTPPSISPFASSYSLAQNYPNPFNPSTTITYTLPQRAHVRIRILDQLGRAIATLVNHEEGNGTHTVSWSGRDDQGRAVGTGTYYYQLVVDNGPIETRKLILLKY